MARRKEEHLAGADASLFVHSDGGTAMLTGDEVYRDPALAQAAWEHVRAATWRHPDRQSMWPPIGAVRWDGITTHTRAASPKSRDWHPGMVSVAVRRDTAAVARFRHARPRAARTISDELDRYVADLEGLARIAETLGDERNELGYAHAARTAWSTWEIPALRKART
jgi:hypothetical protein